MARKTSSKFNSLALGYSAASVAALGMLALGVAHNLGVYVGAAEMMQKWHMFFTFSVGGIIAGMIEAAIISFVFVYLFAWAYNKFI